MNHLVQFLEFPSWVSIVLQLRLKMEIKTKSLLSGNGAQFANTACIVPKLSYDIASKEFLDCRIERISA